MGTSRRRTSWSAGRPDRLPRQAKNEQIAVWFQREGNRVFRGVCAENYSTQPCFHQVDQRTALQQLDRFNPATCLGPVAK